MFRGLIESIYQRVARRLIMKHPEPSFWNPHNPSHCKVQSFVGLIQSYGFKLLVHKGSHTYIRRNKCAENRHTLAKRFNKRIASSSCMGTVSTFFQPCWSTRDHIGRSIGISNPAWHFLQVRCQGQTTLGSIHTQPTLNNCYLSINNLWIGRLIKSSRI